MKSTTGGAGQLSAGSERIRMVSRRHQDCFLARSPGEMADARPVEVIRRNWAYRRTGRAERST